MGAEVQFFQGATQAAILSLDVCLAWNMSLIHLWLLWEKKKEKNKIKLRRKVNESLSKAKFKTL